MGANAQTTVPTFTAGQVLTADQQNQSARTGVPVFADSSARDAAFGGAGEKTLAEGQLAYLENSNIVQYYDGSSWATVGPSIPGLAVVKAETAFSAVSSFTADSVFSSNYTNYQINIRFTTSSTGSLSFQLRSGGVATTTNYNRQYISGNSGASPSVSAASSYGTSSADFALYTNGAFTSAVTMTLFGPQLAESTSYLSLQMWTPATYNNLQTFWAGNQSASTSFDGIGVLVSTGTMTGTYTIYGMAKS